MSTEAKTIPSTEYPFNSKDPLSDEKTRALFKADSKKVLINCFKIAACIASVMLILTIMGGDYSRLHEIFYVSFIASLVSYIFLKNRQYAKYKITINSVRTSSYYDERNSDPAFPGSSANLALQLLNNQRDDDIRNLRKLYS